MRWTTTSAGGTLVALLLFGGCTCDRGAPGGTPRPAGDAGAGIAWSVVAPPSQPASAAAPRSQPASAPVTDFSRPAPPRRSPEALAREARCKESVDAIRSGTALAPDRLDQIAWEGGGRARKPRPEFFDAVSCLAIARDDPTSCAGLAGEAASECRRAVTFYRWARRPAGDRSWRCDEEGRRKAARKGLATAQFEALCAALRAGDASKCPALNTEAADGCRAEVALDPTYCRGRALCVDEIERTKAILKGGLAARLPAAQHQEKVQIEAALNGAAACARPLEALRFSCATGAGPAPAGTKAPAKKPR